MTTNRRDFLKFAGLTMGLSLIDKKSAATPIIKMFRFKNRTKMKLYVPALQFNS